MKRIARVMMCATLLLLASAVGTAAAPQVETLEQKFTTTPARPSPSPFPNAGDFSAWIPFVATSPGPVVVTLSWNGPPLTVALTNTNGAGFRGYSSGNPVNANSPKLVVTYTLGQWELYDGYFWKVLITSQKPVSGNIRITSPKVDKEILAKPLPLRPPVVMPGPKK